MEENVTQATQEAEVAEVTEDNNEQSVQDLMTELAKMKRAADKAASEAAEFKRKYRESLSEVEKASMEKAEQEAAREEEFNLLKRENNINRLEKSYLLLGFTQEEAGRMAIAETDGDQEAKIKIMSEVDARKKKEYEAEFLAKRPDVNIGGSGSMTVTKEQFDAMNPVELTRLKRENEAEFNRLMGL